MGGRPVWLASIALRRRSSGEIRPGATWWADDLEFAQRTLQWLLKGRGDSSRERCFQMVVTTCLHRGLTDEEEALLPSWWHDEPAVHLAGAPIKVLWSRGCADTPSVQPCANPGRLSLGSDPRLWLPEGCGECESCQARAMVERTGLPYHMAVDSAPTC